MDLIHYLAQLQTLLTATDDLVLSEEEDKAGSQKYRKKNNELHQEICCPICFEEMISPKQILCCSNGHAICSNCDRQIKACPVCRESFQKEKNGRPRRNLFAERLVSLYMQSLKQ